MEKCKLVKTDYEKSYDEALNIWDNLSNVHKDLENIGETDKCPMHPYLFFQLSTVSNFNQLNGKNYKEYVEKWKIKGQKFKNF